jgi:epoxide hydrolase-like predicted phosphatase
LSDQSSSSGSGSGGGSVGSPGSRGGPGSDGGPASARLLDIARSNMRSIVTLFDRLGKGAREPPVPAAYDGCVSPTERRPSGLILDWGGVLTMALDSATGAWLEHDRVSRDHFRDVMLGWVGRRGPGPSADADAGAEPVADLEQADDEGPAGQSPVHRLERGELPAAEFEVVLAQELTRRGSPVVAAGLLRRMLGGLEKLDDDMLGLTRRAHQQGIRTALLSNSWGDHYPEQLWDGLFDVVVISGRVGMRKPEARIFEYTCSRLGLPPAGCVMVDDLPHNVAAAVTAGLVAVQHRSYDETAAELEVLFGVPLR